MSKSKYHALTIRKDNGKTYWQLPHKTCEKAMSHAIKNRKNNGYILVFKANEDCLKELQYVYMDDSNNPNNTWVSLTYLKEKEVA